MNRLHAIGPVIGMLAGLATPSWAGQDAPVLVELFTSQGCYSCPAADIVLGELAQRDDVVALAFHVTYWDRLGWPDTFGQPQFTQRQYDYAGMLGARSVYTPQAVVAGEIELVGSSRDRLARAIDFVRREGQATRLDIDATGMVMLPAHLRDDAIVLWAAAYDSSETVAIERGENAGKVLDYHNIVKDYRELNFSEVITLPFAQWRESDLDGIVLVAQARTDGRVLAIGRQHF